MLLYLQILLEGLKMAEKEKLYIANDIEMAATREGVHRLCFRGARVVTEEKFSKEELLKQGLVYYDEIQPITWEYNEDAMRVGCLGLRCLDECQALPAYNPRSEHFEPRLVLDLLHHKGTHPMIATLDFQKWIAHVGRGREIVPVVDTVFFDSAHILYYFSQFSSHNPYGHAGIDMDSFFRGYRKNMSATLGEAAQHIDRGVHHNALDDAIFLATISREIIYNGALA